MGQRCLLARRPFGLSRRRLRLFRRRRSPRLVLALLTTESLHGEAQTRLDAAHYFDADQRACVIGRLHAAAARQVRTLQQISAGMVSGNVSGSSSRPVSSKHEDGLSPA